MEENRKDYRKKLTSPGIIYLAGEQLKIVCYDISVQGIQVELMPGELICTIDDIRNLLSDAQQAEVFVQDLGLSAQVNLAWAQDDQEKILLGLEFTEVRHNSQKLWLKRRFYRKSLITNAKIISHNQRLEAQTVNFSTDGMRLRCSDVALIGIKPDQTMTIDIPEKALNALAIVIWVNTEISFIEFGVRYIPTL